MISGWQEVFYDIFFFSDFIYFFGLTIAIDVRKLCFIPLFSFFPVFSFVTIKKSLPPTKSQLEINYGGI